MAHGSTAPIDIRCEQRLARFLTSNPQGNDEFIRLRHRAEDGLGDITHRWPRVDDDAADNLRSKERAQ